MSAQPQPTKWERAADYVLCVLLAEDTMHASRERWDKARYEHGLAAYHFPPGQARHTFEALEVLRYNATPPHQSLILAQDNRITPDWLALRIALYSELVDGAVFYNNLKIMLDCGETARLNSEIKTAGAALDSGGNRDEVIAKLMTNLATPGAETILNDTAFTAGTELEAYINAPPTKNLLTGIPCIDQWTGGIGEDDVIAITGPYKMRKSTLARNIALNLARRGASVAVLMYESNKRMVAALFVTMLAIEYLRRSQLYDALDVNGNPLRWINVRDLVRIRAGYRQWDARKVAAIDYGIAEFKKLASNLRIYDKSRDGGALSDLSSGHRVMLRDKNLYGTDLAIIDHVTQIMEQGSIYDRMQKIAPFLETFARHNKIALCALAQLNEETVKGSHDGYSPGVKGGGDLPAAVDYLFKVLYQEKDAAGTHQRHLLRVVAHLSRYGEGGSDVFDVLTIDPTTGMILRTGKP